MSVQRDELRWAERALERVADLEARAAALKRRAYCGAGFSYEWPESLANTRRQIEEMTRHEGKERAWRQIIASVRLELKAKEIHLAELCAAGDCRHRWQRPS